MGSGSSREVHYSQGREREREREQGRRREGAGTPDSHSHGHRPYHRSSSENAYSQERSRSIRGRSGRSTGYSERYPEVVPSSGIASGRGVTVVKPVRVDADVSSFETGRAQQLPPHYSSNDGSSSSTSSVMQPASTASEGSGVTDAWRSSERLLFEPHVSTYNASGSTSSSGTTSNAPLSYRHSLTSDDNGQFGRGQIELAASEDPVTFEAVYVNTVVGSVGQASDGEDPQLACETNFRRNRVNEMQERLRRYAGLPPSLNIQDLERRGILSAETHIGVQRRRVEVMSGSFDDVGQNTGVSTNSDAFDLPAWSSPSLRSWDGSPGSHHQLQPVYTEAWEGNVTVRRAGNQGHDHSSPQMGSSGQVSSPPVETSSVSRSDSGGRESRRTGGRRLWDAITRAASHRRTTTVPTAVVVPEEVEEYGSSTDRWALRDFRSAPDDERFGETGVVHSSRSLDLEERRRRVRSQVWALQRLSNGLEGVPSHGTPCCRGGQHHGSRCSCESYATTDDTNTRASISRIIMLAEALFEVLDEIHRQSVALSRSATVSLASLPAPDTVVDAIPVRIHKKPESTKDICEDVAQCYICLVEYEEGDHVRVLPCQHEYHMACVDKWLKEIHRVCPLCRGNVCESVGTNRS